MYVKHTLVITITVIIINCIEFIGKFFENGQSMQI